MLAFFVDRILTKVEEQMSKISQTAGAQLTFGRVYHMQMQCARQRLGEKLQQINTAETMQ
jgi:hypothetical protein